jgi:putative membrane protein
VVGKPFDIGLQAERTALSWQRTTLSLAVGVLLAGRLLVVVLGSLSYLVVGGGLMLVVGLFLLGYRRYESAHFTLVTSVGERVPLTSALPLFIWAFAVFIFAVGGMILAIVGVFVPTFG